MSSSSNIEYEPTLKDQRSFFQKNRMAIIPWLFLLPAVLFFITYVIFPIFQSLWISLYEWDGLYRPDGTWTGQWVGFENYQKLWTDPKFWTSLKNNIAWLFLFTLAVPLGLFIALFLNQTVAGMRFYKSMFFFPFVISQVVVGLIFGWFYNPDFGVVGQVWKFMFCEEVINIVGNVSSKCSIPPPALLASEEYATYGIIAAGLWPQIAYCMILYLTGLNNVSPDQIEAARIDGAKKWKMLWYVVLPQLKPATFIAIVVTVIGALRSFDMIAIMTAGGPGIGSTNVLAYYMYETALSEFGFRYGYGSAIASVLFMIMLFYIGYFLYKMYKDERGR